MTRQDTITLTLVLPTCNERDYLEAIRPKQFLDIECRGYGPLRAMRSRVVIATAAEYVCASHRPATGLLTPGAEYDTTQRRVYEEEGTNRARNVCHRARSSATTRPSAR